MVSELYVFLEDSIEKKLKEDEQFYSTKIILEMEEKYVNFFSEQTGKLFLYVSGYFFLNKFEPQFVFLNEKNLESLTLYNLFSYFRKEKLDLSDLI